MKLTALLASARAKFGAAVHLREMPDGERQVILFHGLKWVGTRDSSGVEVIDRRHAPWSAFEIRP